MKKKIIIITAIITATLFGGTALAYQRDRHENRMEHIHERLSEKLDLNEQQEEKLHDIIERFEEFSENKEKRAEKAIKSIVTQDKLSVKDAEKLLNMRRLQAEKKRTMMAEQLAAFHAVLTPEQRLKAAEMLMEHREHHGMEHMGHRGMEHMGHRGMEHMGHRGMEHMGHHGKYKHRGHGGYDN